MSVVYDSSVVTLLVSELVVCCFSTTPQDSAINVNMLPQSAFEISRNEIQKCAHDTLDVCGDTPDKTAPQLRSSLVLMNTACSYPDFHPPHEIEKAQSSYSLQ